MEEKKSIDSEQLLQALEEVAARIGVKVRYENLVGGPVRTSEAPVEFAVRMWFLSIVICPRSKNYMPSEENCENLTWRMCLSRRLPENFSKAKGQSRERNYA